MISDELFAVAIPCIIVIYVVYSYLTYKGK
jgi:hypothetical protein